MKEHDFVLDVFSVVKPVFLAAVGSSHWWDSGITAGWRVCNWVSSAFQGALFVTQISEKDTDHRCASLSCDAIRKKSWWSYVDSWKWRISFPGHLLLWSVSRECWRAPQTVSHQDLAAQPLPEIFWDRITVCSSKYTLGEKNPKTNQQNKQTKPPQTNLKYLRCYLLIFTYISYSSLRFSSCLGHYGNCIVFNLQREDCSTKC